MVRSDFRGRRRAERRVRAGLWFLALSAIVPGVWALFFPQAFFDDFPGFGFAWVRLLPPYNEHLVTDVGGFYLAFGLMFLVCAVRMDRRLSSIVIAGWLVFSVPHLIFHLGHLSTMGSNDKLWLSVSLALVVVLPAVMLMWARQSDRRYMN